MAQYQPRVNIHDLTQAEYEALQAGQHIRGHGGNGRWLGLTANNVGVVAWAGGAKQRGGMRRYMRNLRDYQKGTYK